MPIILWEFGNCQYSNPARRDGSKNNPAAAGRRRGVVPIAAGKSLSVCPGRREAPLPYSPLMYCTASVAAMAPSAVAVTSWRRRLARLSPATNTPGVPVWQSSPARA